MGWVIMLERDDENDDSAYPARPPARMRILRYSRVYFFFVPFSSFFSSSFLSTLSGDFRNSHVCGVHTFTGNNQTLAITHRKRILEKIVWTYRVKNRWPKKKKKNQCFTRHAEIPDEPKMFR